jgi:23S rRNA (guanosine2251-2'-O)-methyltransferase
VEAQAVSDPEPAPLYGRHAIIELLRAGGRRVEEIAVLAEGRGPALQELVALARSRHVKISYRTRDQLTAMARTPQHQGVVARVAEVGYAPLEELLAIPASRGEPGFFLILDRIQDPRNLGAVLRSAEATGVHGVILPRHRAAGLTPAAGKSAAGALEHVAVAREVNIVHAIEILKRSAVWVMGAALSGGKPPWAVDLTGPVGFVLGGESEGLRPLVARGCDELLTLPMRGTMASLNVSAAAAVLCYEVVRQRLAKLGKTP